MTNKPESVSNAELDELEVAEVLLAQQGFSNLAAAISAAYTFIKESRAVPAEDVRTSDTADRIRAAMIADAEQEGVNIAEGRFGKNMAALCRALDAEDVRAMVDEPVGYVSASSLECFGESPTDALILCAAREGHMDPAPLYREGRRKFLLAERMYSLLPGADYWNACLAEIERLNGEQS